MHKHHKNIHEVMNLAAKPGFFKTIMDKFQPDSFIFLQIFLRIIHTLAGVRRLQIRELIDLQKILFPQAKVVKQAKYIESHAEQCLRCSDTISFALKAI